MKISIITVCYNSDKTIERTLKSVESQIYSDIEYIVIDGASTDRTNDIISSYSHIVDVHVSEKDHGLYDAMNKGIALATGDVIGILNSDDIFFNDTVIQRISAELNNCDGVYGDVGFYADKDFQIKKRHYSSKGFSLEQFSRGMMPAHPSFYVKRELLLKAGEYNTDFKIAADFDMLLRLFLLKNVNYRYIPQELVKMLLGGVSTAGFRSNLLLNKEVIKSCHMNGIESNWLYILSKYPKKIMGLLFK
jgi:glycosyltransferase involved in cell wall biosynthesis